MDVNQLRDRILQLSHDEDAPDTGLKTKSLNWLNSAYHELMDELAPFMDRFLVQTETLTTSGGQGTLSAGVWRVLQVVDKTHNRVLHQNTLANIQKQDPGQTKTGTPTTFWLENQTLHVYPAADIEVEVVYQPVVDDLVENGTESTIKLPTQFHDALIWGGLVWSAVYERGLATQGELNLFQAKWQAAKQKVKLSLAAQPAAFLRVNPVSDL